MDEVFQKEKRPLGQLKVNKQRSSQIVYNFEERSWKDKDVLIIRGEKFNVYNGELIRVVTGSGRNFDIKTERERN